MNIRLNGETHEVKSARTILELLGELSLPLQTVIVEHNGLALRRNELSQSVLSENDQVEVVKVVAGG